MPLILKVIKYKNNPPKENLFYRLDRQECFIGRSPDNDLVLPDPEKCISRKHAVIKYEKGYFYLTDTSAAGTVLTNKNINIHNNTVKLTDGDQIKIGDYDLVVSISEEEPIQPENQPPIRLEDFNFGEPPNDSDFPEIPAPLEVDDQNIKETEAEGANVEEAFVTKQEPVKEQLQDQIILDQNLSAGEPQPVTPVASESTRQSNQETARELFNIFLKAAGVKDNTLFPPEKISECMGIVGSVFKEMIKGLMVILRGRAELKNQFKVDMTILGSANNNPLKFSPNLEDAITLMLLKNRPGFIDSSEAVRQGFADIMNHQLATNAGLQASLTELLSRFDPQHFSEKFNEGIVFQKKSKCWDAYCHAYPEIVRIGSNNFFGEEFARVYEEQMSKLKCSRKPEKESRVRKQDE